MPSFKIMGHPVLEKIFKVFTICGRGDRLGHVTSIMSSDFHSLVPESLHTKFGLDRYSGF